MALSDLRDATLRFASASETAEVFRKLPEHPDYAGVMGSRDGAFPFSAIPLAVGERTLKTLSDAVSTAHGILEKITGRYISDPEYRRLFAFSENLERLILLPCDYGELIPFGRYDLFVGNDGESFKFCEFNTDGSGGMSRDSLISSAVARNAADCGIADARPFDTIGEFSKVLVGLSGKARPRVAVCDFREEGVFSDFDFFIRKLKAMGADARFADIRELRFDGKTLRCGDGSPVDIIYRRAVSHIVADKIGECDGLIQALEHKAVRLAGHFRTSVAHSKLSMYAMRHEATARFLSDEEKDFIEKHIPRTYILDDNLSDAVMREARANKDGWIMKPFEGFASKGVLAGMDCTRAEWSDALDAACGRGYILQEMCGRTEYPTLWADGTLRDLPLMVGAYQAAGKCVGFYNRAGAQGVIDYHHGGIFVPTVRVM